MKLLLTLATSSLLLVSAIREGRPRFIQDCTVSPPGIQDEQTPAKPDDIIEINCTSDTEYAACIFRHIKPLDVGHENGQAIECSISGGESHCGDDPRITITGSRDSCSLRINNPDPDDTGIWKVTLLEWVDNDFVTDSKKVEIFTYNQTETTMLDMNDNEITNNNYDVNYNEQHSLTCYSQYGRPGPQFTWFIGSSEITYDDMFRVRDLTGISHDPSGYVRDRYSDINFQIDTYFLQNLIANYIIDVNPESGVISFDLICVAEQGSHGEYNLDQVKIRIAVHF